MGSAAIGATAVPRRLATYEILDELGARPQPTLIARHTPAGGKPSLIVLERFAGVMRGGRADGTAFLRRAKQIATLAHPNLAKVRGVSVEGDDVLVASAYFDGEKLSQLWRFDSEAMPLDVGLRVLVGVLAGLEVLHGLRDADPQPMRLAHGEIAPTTILFGIDGAARVLYAAARQLPGATPEGGSIEYLAPEALEHQPYDERADVFAVGVLLWELLTGRRLRIGEARAAASSAGAADDAPLWVRALADVAERALQPSPADRWPSAAAMAREITELAGSRVAPVSAAASWFNARAGERVRARRAKLEAAGAPDSSQSVVLPRWSLRAVGANTGARARAHVATLPLIQVAEAVRALEDSTADALPSESNVPGRQPSDSIVGASIPIAAAGDAAPCPADRPADNAPNDTGRGHRRRGLLTACAAAAAALAFSVGVISAGPLRRAHSTSSPQATREIETVPAELAEASLVDKTFLETPHLNARALPEPSSATPKHAPFMRTPGHVAPSGSRRATR